MVNAVLVALVRLGDEATMVYPVAALSMLMLVKVATPAIAAAETG